MSKPVFYAWQVYGALNAIAWLAQQGPNRSDLPDWMMASRGAWDAWRALACYAVDEPIEDQRAREISGCGR